VNPKDFDRILFITRHFKELKGLESAVPTGLMLLGTGIPGFLPGNGLVLPLLVVAVCWLGWILIWRRAPSYYRAILGEVEQPPRQRSLSKSRPAELLALLIPALVFVEGGWHINVSARSLLAGLSGIFLFRWVWRGHRRSQVHCLALGGFLLGVLACVTQEQLDLGLANFLCGAVMILGGLLDHRFLVREMGQLAASRHEIEATAATAGMETQR